MTQNVNIDLTTPRVEKDKNATKTYRFDAAQILSAGDAIASASWAVAGSGINIDAQSFTETSLSVRLSGGTPEQWYAVVCTYQTALGDVDQLVLRVYIKDDAESVSALGCDLFPNRFTAVEMLRRDRLLMAAQGSMPMPDVSDDYLWEKLLAAEASAKRILRVPFRPTQFFPDAPTQPQIDALPQGMPWGIDPGYDYEPDFFRSEGWGFMRLRQRPLQSVQSVQILFPAAQSNSYTIPGDWIRFDAKYADVQFIPASGSGSVPLNAFMLQALGMGRRIPFSLRVTYQAGLIASEWPDLIDAVKKMAVLKTLEDKFLPSSGSISADGLSQSVSSDMDKYRDSIDEKFNGPKGRNGGLVAAIHGIRVGAL